MTNARCHCCGRALADGESLFHRKCARQLFGSSRIPALDYSHEELNELARQSIVSRVSVPGVQPKISLHLESMGGQTGRLTLEGDFIPSRPHLPGLSCRRRSISA